MNAGNCSRTNPAQCASAECTIDAKQLVLSKFISRNQAIEGLMHDLQALRAGERGHVSLFLINVERQSRTQHNEKQLAITVDTIAKSLLDFAPYGRVRTTKPNQLMFAIVSGSNLNSIIAAAENLHGSIQLDLAQSHLFPGLAIGASNTATAGVCAKTLLMQASMASANALRDRTHISVFNADEYHGETPLWYAPRFNTRPKLRIVR